MSARLDSSQRLETRLVELLGPAAVTTDPDLMRAYEVDWTGRFVGRARAVVHPSNTSQVAEVVSLCREAGVPLVAQGGNTGLVGGGVPDPSGTAVVLSTRRLNEHGPVEHGQVTVGAGMTLAEVQELARGSGWQYGVDLGARDSATIGGTLATNAGGIRVCAYGMTRAQVLGVEAVLPNGEIVSRLDGLLKDNTGYDLAGLLVGSEGTLGVITAARLRLQPRVGDTVVAMVGVEDCAHAQRLAGSVAGVAGLAREARLLAVELIDAASMDAVAALDGARAWPVERSPWVLLLEVELGSSARDDSPEVPPDLVELLAGATVAESQADRRRLWAWRERITVAVGELGPPGSPVHKFDVSLPLGRLHEAASRLPGVVAAAAPGCQLAVFGHLADGNLHVELCPAPECPTVPDEADHAVLQLVVGLGGSISAEHGIGRAKSAWLDRDRQPGEVEAMRAIKHAWDPEGLFNPGVLFHSL